MTTAGQIDRRAAGRLVAGALALALLAGCETRYPDGPPLRDASSPTERLYLRCVINDPVFLTPECRQFGGKDR